MAFNPNLVTVGTINSGATPIQADVSQGLGSAVAVKVLLSTNYALLIPPGWPQRPGLTGVAAGKLGYPGDVILSGTTLAFLKPEADALVSAGAGSYA